MNLTSEFGNTEQWFLVIFFILYLVYLGRIFWIAKRLGTSARSSILKFILRGSYFGLLLLALLNPSFGDMSDTAKVSYKNIFLLVDASKSMDATDIQPSRLEKTKFEISRFINHFNKDRIGLIVFSQDAFILSPLTFDQNALNWYIPKITASLLPAGGTDFNPAMQLALEKLSKIKSKNQSKIVVLISDGENFGDNIKDKISEIKQQHINFFSIGVGTTNGITLREGSNYKKDDEGNIVVTKLEASTLKEISSKTSGKYFEISSISANLNELINAVENIPVSLTDEHQVDTTQNKYFYFLIIALFLQFIDVFFTIRTFQL